MPVYKKLVRDRIPEIIMNSGKKLQTCILSDTEYISELKIKAQEELREYLETDSTEAAIEELADLLEVTIALAKSHGASLEQLEAVRQLKAEAKGRFEDKVFLVKVED